MPRSSISPSSSASTTFSLPIPTPKRQLTRSRKLRHLEDHEILDFDIKSPPCEGHSPINAATYSDRSSVNINSGDINLVQFSTAVPHPLPLPDLSALLFVSDRNKEPMNAFRLPSPQEAREGDIGRAKGSERETRIDKPFEVASSGISQRDARINWDAPRNGDHVPFRSTPATGFSSPILSPQRLSAVDLVSSCHASYQGWSSTEMCSQDATLGFQCIASQELGFFTHESSPIPSPKMTSSVQTRSASRPTSPVPPKLFVEASNLHVDNSGPLSGHPLPLPPGAAAVSPSQPIFKISPVPSLLPQASTLSSPNPHTLEQSSPHPQLFSGQSSTHSLLFNVQSSQSPQITPKSEFLPRKNQWSKGKLIGRGTFGSVYAATHRETGALCAMKEVELCHDDFKSIESMKQLQQEIMVLSHLKHPNIVQYYGSEIIDDKFYIYLEYIYPGSINKYVRELCGAITESVVRNFTRHILSGLAYLHGMKTIHRDIKGANLLVDAFGVVKLADFGMAKHLTGQAADLSFKGSPYWMAPELMQAVIESDNRSDLALAVDIWSLGCTVIEMLTGRPPWSEYEGVAAMFKVLRESPPIPEKLSIQGKDFLCWCFQRNPAHRPSASKLLEHPFVRNSQQQDSPYHLPPSTSSGTLILDKT